MKTYRIDHLGSFDGVVLHDEQVPTPGAGEVLVRVHATALNYRDTFVLNGWIPGAKANIVPLTDAAGEIAEVGIGVRRFKAGDRVANYFFTNWIGGPYNRPETYTVEHDGWLTQYKVVNAEALVAIPSHLSFEEAATLPCVGTTAWSAVKGIGAGDTILTQGSGAVSIYAIQLAKAFGARVIATTSSDDKAARLIALGADEVINYAEVPNWGERALALTGGRGVDRIVEIGGGASLAQSMKAITPGGQVSLVGNLTGGDGKVDYLAMFLSMARYVPIPVGSRSDLEEAIRVIAQHDIRPVIDSTFAFDDANAAMAHFAKGKLFGKVIIRH